LTLFRNYRLLRPEKMKRAFLIIALSLAAMSPGAFARGEGETATPVDVVVLGDGNAATGYVTDITGDGTVMLASEFSATPVEIALSRISGINMNTKNPDMAKIRRGWIFYLADGTRVTGRIVEWGEESVTIHVDYAGDVKVSRAVLLRVSVSGDDFFAQPPEGDKAAVYPVAADGQPISGALKEVSPDTIVVAGETEREFRAADVQGIALPVSKEVLKLEKQKTTPGWYAFVDMPNSDRLIGQIDHLGENRLHLITKFCGVVEIRRETIARINFSSTMRQSFGNSLVADKGRGLVIEIDPQGKEVWTYKCDSTPSDARMLPDGNVLITSQQTGSVYEVDKQRNIVWAKKGLNVPLSAVRLPNGNTAIAEFGNFRIVICDRQGNQVKALLEGNVQPNWVDVTAQGTILVANDAGNAMEVDMDNKVLWVATGMYGAACARMMPNGQVAVLARGGFASASSSIRIFQKPSVLVKTIELGYGQPAFKVLPNGNLLVVIHARGDTSSNPILREIDPTTGKTVRETRIQSAGYQSIDTLDRD